MTHLKDTAYVNSDGAELKRTKTTKQSKKKKKKGPTKTKHQNQNIPLIINFF